MLERRRRNKQHYDAVPGGEEELEGLEDSGERDLELGEGFGAGQETGRIDGDAAAAAPPAQAGEGAQRTVTEELDNWDETVEDEWEEAEADVDEAAAGKSAKRAE